MHPLSEEQVERVLSLDEKCASEPPSGKSANIPKTVSVQDFEILDSGLSQTWAGNSKRRSVSVTSSQSHRLIHLKEPSLEELATKGAELRSHEVWVWGSGKRGQLGQGDILSRPSPVIIPDLLPHYVLNISAGSQHALALTGSGQVYGWGNNNKGQSNPSDFLAVVPYPTKIQLPRGETVRSILARENSSVMVCDSGNIYYTGVVSSTKSRLHCIKLKDMNLEPDHQPVSLLAAGTKIIVNAAPTSPFTRKLVSIEKTLLDQVEVVSNLISTLYPGSPNSKRSSNRSKSNKNPLLEVYDSLESAKDLLSACVKRSLNCHLLNDYVSTGLYRYTAAWKTVCCDIGWRVGNCITLDCLLLDSHQTQHQHLIVDILISKFGLHQKSIKGQMELEQLVLELFKLSEKYIKALMELHTKVEDGKHLMDKITGLMGLHQSLERERQESEDSRSFWKTSGSKLEEYCIANRRLILDNRYQPLSLSGSMSKHWIILMSDILLDVGYGTAVHPLITVWLDSPPVTGSTNKFEIVLTMPEETKTFVTNTVGTRNIWVKGFLRAIAGCTRSQTNGSNLPPVIRNVEYEFHKGELRGAVYKGSMTQARMHGKGRLQFPDGSFYLGEWRNGARNGWGSFSMPDGSIQEGVWRMGKLTGRGKLRKADGSMYDGDLVDGLPNGHGTRKEGKFMGQGASVYIGEWEKGVKHGYGVLDDIMTGEKYMGMWLAGVRHGKGCVVNSDGIYYEGNFVSNRLTGGGIMIFEDGSVYEGEFCGAGEFNGRGVLTTKSDRFEGVFHGNYSDGMKFNGTVYKISEPETPTVIDNSNKIQRYTVSSSLKWISVFSKFDLLLGSEKPWNQIAIAINQNKTLSADNVNNKPKDLDYLETIPDIAQSNELKWDDFKEILRYLTAASTCPLHPFYLVLQQIVNCFNISLGGVRSHPTLLPHAKDELQYISDKLYTSLRKLFPSLPGTEKCAWIINTAEENESMMVTSNSLLYPLLLPSIYPTLFHLYIQKEEKLDKEYWSRILRWNKHSDAALLTFFDVDISPWDLPVDRRSRDELFVDAVYTLQRLKTTFTPGDKLEVIVEMFKAITGESGTSEHTWSMDSLLPVCMYVVVRARVLQLGAELAMLSDLMDTYLFQGEKGIMFTTLQAAYTQILRENVFIN